MSRLFTLPKIHFESQVALIRPRIAIEGKNEILNFKEFFINPLKITKAPSFFQSNVRQLGSLSKKVALPTIVCGLTPT